MQCIQKKQINKMLFLVLGLCVLSLLMFGCSQDALTSRAVIGDAVHIQGLEITTQGDLSFVLLNGYFNNLEVEQIMFDEERVLVEKVDLSIGQKKKITTQIASSTSERYKIPVRIVYKDVSTGLMYEQTVTLQGRYKTS